MQDYMLEIKDRFANVCKHVNVLTGNDVWLVGVYSKKTGKLLANYQLKDFPEFKSYTALVAHAKANDLSTSCPVPVPSEDGATSTAESTPQDNPLSNGVPVSDVLPNRFNRDDLMLLRLCTTDRLAKLHADAPFCNFSNQRLIDDVNRLRSDIDQAIADLDNCIEETVNYCVTCLDLPERMRCGVHDKVCEGAGD